MYVLYNNKINVADFTKVEENPISKIQKVMKFWQYIKNILICNKLFLFAS